MHKIIIIMMIIIRIIIIIIIIIIITYLAQRCVGNFTDKKFARARRV